MRLFLCGHGAGIEAIMQMLAEAAGKATVAVYSPDADCLRLAERLGMCRNAGEVNQWHLWPFEPDLIVSCGCLEILTPAVLGKTRAINCHYALLPNHRGRSAVPWAIVDGDTVTGVTWHWIDPGIDTGKVLLQAACQIEPDETQATLFGKLHRLAAVSFPAAMAVAGQGMQGWEQRGRRQYHRAGPPHGGAINPSWPDEYIEGFIRAMTLPPRPYATYEGVEVRSMAEYVQLREAMRHERHHRQPV